MKSPLGIALIATGLLFASVSVACSGLDTGDLVRVSVNEPVRKAQGTSPTVTLNEAYVVYEDYIADGERFAVEIQDAEERRAFLNSLVNMGTEVAVPLLGEVPGGAILTSLLLGAGGLLTGRKMGENKLKPEIQKAMRQAADAAWDEARETTLADVRAGVSVAKGE